MKLSTQKALELLTAGIADCMPREELALKLDSGAKLNIKLGMDPTAPDLHLGHAVVLRKMRQFQDLGHNVIFLIGDYTARIGDPSGKSKTRPPLSDADIVKNSETYFTQVGKILDLSKLTICYNSQWLSKLSFADTIKLCSKMTVARLIEREDFARRLEQGVPIAMHELLYPIMQAYDSVALEADVELGGTDQTFNLLCGRFLQEQFGQKAQVVMTLPILEGLDGVEKMSKSLGNSVGLAEDPSNAYGKLMSLPDGLVQKYQRLLLATPEDQIAGMQKDIAAGTLHPMTVKKKMAHDIVSLFWSSAQADAGQAQFEALFQKKDFSQATTVMLRSDLMQTDVWITTLLQELGAISSSSEAKRLIESGAVTVDDVVVRDFKAQVQVKQGSIVKAGKHKIYKIG